jgi:hypothetical protein
MLGVSLTGIASILKLLFKLAMKLLLGVFESSLALTQARVSRADVFERRPQLALELVIPFGRACMQVRENS